MKRKSLNSCDLFNQTENLLIRKYIIAHVLVLIKCIANLKRYMTIFLFMKSLKVIQYGNDIKKYWICQLCLNHKNVDKVMNSHLEKIIHDIEEEHFERIHKYDYLKFDFEQPLYQ